MEAWICGGSSSVLVTVAEPEMTARLGLSPGQMGLVGPGLAQFIGRSKTEKGVFLEPSPNFVV